MSETQVQLSGWEGPLKMEIATLSSILAWKISRIEEDPGKLWFMVLEEILESHLDCKEVKPVYPKGNKS